MRSIPQRQGSFPHSSQMTRWLRDLIPMNDQVGTNSAAISQFFQGLLSVFGLCKSFAFEWNKKRSGDEWYTFAKKRDAVSISLGFFFFFFSFRGFIKEKVWSHFSLHTFQCVGQDESEPDLVMRALNFEMQSVLLPAVCLRKRKQTKKNSGGTPVCCSAAPLQAVPVLFIDNGCMCGGWLMLDHLRPTGSHGNWRTRTWQRDRTRYGLHKKKAQTQKEVVVVTEAAADGVTQSYLCFCMLVNQKLFRI